MRNTLRAAIFAMGMLGATSGAHSLALADSTEQGSQQRPPAPPAAFQKIKEACQADETRLCSSYAAQDGQRPSPELGRCMKQNYANLSAACQEAMNQARPPHPPRDREPASDSASSGAI